MINIKSIVRRNIVDLKPYSCARDEYSGDDGVFLDANENPYGVLNRYPDPLQFDLKRKLSLLKSVNTNNIFIGNGSDEVIDLAFRIFCKPGLDKALTFSPSYGMYAVSAAINNIELLELPLNKMFQIELGELKPFLADENLKIIFICSPNNPTGNLISREDIEYILHNFNGIVIVDEAYIDFAAADSIIPLIYKYNNLIVSQTFSKAWGLAGARVGSAFAVEEITMLFNKVKPPYNVSQISQEATLNALNDYRKFEDLLGLILSEKARLIKRLSTMRVIKVIYPSDANFLLIKVEDADYLYTGLIKQKIITRNRSSQLANCLRISIGTPAENDALIDALEILT